ALIQEHRFAQGEESLREDRRLMYVAVTRARRRLLLTSAAWRTGLSSARPRSRYLAEVTPLVPDAFRSVQGVPEHNPLERERPRSRAAALLTPVAGQEGAPEDPELAELVRRAVVDLEQQAAPPVVHSPPRLSASQVVHQARSPQAAALDLLRPLPRQPSAAAARGTAFHAWLESRYDSAALLDLEDLLDLDDADGAEAALEDRALREAFTASEWADRSPIAVEQPVHTRVGEIAVRGVIDAVF